MKNLTKTISITSYNRPEILTKCLNSLHKCELIDQYNIVIIQQKYNEKFKRIFDNFKYKFTNFKIIKTSYPNNWGPYKKMTINGYKGFEFCFEKLKSDIGYYLEDDIVVSNDYLIFSEYILNKYKNDTNFFAVNGFSKELFDKSKINLYSKFVYGIGKGWGIHNDKWKTIKKFWNKKFINSLNPEYVSPIENFIKKNNFYVVMPICSRTYEQKSKGVSIVITDNKYFSEFKSSFVHIKNKNFHFKYSFFSNYSWRKDCKKYKGKILGILEIKVRNILKTILRMFFK